MYMHALSPAALAMDLDEFGWAKRSAIAAREWLVCRRTAAVSSAEGRWCVHGGTVERGDSRAGFARHRHRAEIADAIARQRPGILVVNGDQRHRLESSGFIQHAFR